jgi:hypothetical protein
MTAKARRENPKSVGKREQCVAGLNDGILNHLNPPSDVFCTVCGGRQGGQNVSRCLKSVNIRW